MNEIPGCNRGSTPKPASRGWAFIGRLHGDDERELVLRAAAGFAAVALATEIGGVDLDRAFERGPASCLVIACISLCLIHQAVPVPEELPLVVAHTQMPHQLQRTHLGRAHGQQIQRQEPARPPPLHTGEHGIRDQTGLALAGRAVPKPMAVSIRAAAGAHRGRTNPFAQRVHRTACAQAACVPYRSLKPANRDR